MSEVTHDVEYPLFIALFASSSAAAFVKKPMAVLRRWRATSGFSNVNFLGILNEISFRLSNGMAACDDGSRR